MVRIVIICNYRCFSLDCRSFIGYTLSMQSYYERLVQLSPYPVYITSVPFRFSGCFWYGDGSGMQPYEKPDFRPHIDISPFCTQNDEICTLVHEIGHAIHYRRHCKCYCTDDIYLRELHAYRFSLRFMLRYKMMGALRYEHNCIKNHAIKHSQVYQDVFAKIKTEKIWKKIENFFGSH